VTTFVKSRNSPLHWNCWWDPFRVSL